jgi:hypothetical protein
MVSEDAFYEKAGSRDGRYERLVRQVAVEDAAWILPFLAWLRGDAGMRNASLVGAADAVKARLDAAMASEASEAAEEDGTRNRQLVDAVLRPADEPGELLACWTGRYRRAIPKPVKRGIGDAGGRLYSEYSLLK